MKVLIVILGLYSSVQAKDFEREIYEKPLRELSVIVSETGYFPQRLVAFQGERVKFYVTSTTAKNKCFVLQKHKVFLAAEKGRVNEGEIVLDNAGKFKFYCPSFNHQGFLTVIGSGVEETRAPASNKPEVWMPREYDE